MRGAREARRLVQRAMTLTLAEQPTSAKDLASRLENAKSILQGLSGPSSSHLDAPSAYRDKLASAKHRRFKQREMDYADARRLEAQAALGFEDSAYGREMSSKAKLALRRPVNKEDFKGPTRAREGVRPGTAPRLGQHGLVSEHQLYLSEQKSRRPSTAVGPRSPWVGVSRCVAWFVSWAPGC